MILKDARQNRKYEDIDFTNELNVMKESAIVYLIKNELFMSWLLKIAETKSIYRLLTCKPAMDNRRQMGGADFQHLLMIICENTAVQTPVYTKNMSTTY